jgi:hypothetical protein
LYVTTLAVWFLIHSYYETFLFFFTIEISQIIGPLHFTSPEIINDEYTYRLGNGIFRLSSVESITFTILITIPLLLATSGISLVNKITMTLLGSVFLFLFQVLFLLIVFYKEIYHNYPVYIQKGIQLDEIINYTLIKSWIFLQLNDSFNTIFKFVAALGIWMGLVSYYKRDDRQVWIRKLF